MSDFVPMPLSDKQKLVLSRYWISLFDQNGVDTSKMKRDEKKLEYEMLLKKHEPRGAIEQLEVT